MAALPPSIFWNTCEVYENLPQETLSLYSDLWVELGVG